MEQFRQFLKSIAPISEDEFVQARPFFSEQQLRKGDYFAQEGKICKHAAFIVKGTLRTYYFNDDSEEITACFCIENNLTTSYKSFILQQPSTVIVQAMEETHLVVIDYDNLQKLYQLSPVWQAIGRIITEREYLVMEQYASVLNSETAMEKYLRLIKEQPHVLQKASLEEIASYLGVTRRTLSRIRKEI